MKYFVVLTHFHSWQTLNNKTAFSQAPGLLYKTSGHSCSAQSEKYNLFSTTMKWNVLLLSSIESNNKIKEIESTQQILFFYFLVNGTSTPAVKAKLATSETVRGCKESVLWMTDLWSASLVSGSNRDASIWPWDCAGEWRLPPVSWRTEQECGQRVGELDLGAGFTPHQACLLDELLCHDKPKRTN